MLFSIKTFGCKVNQYESSAITSAMKCNGFIETLDDDKADIVIVNSCTVTSGSDKKAKQTINRLRRSYPEKIIVLTGCFPQAFPDEAKDSGADIITGTGNRTDIPKLIEDYLQNRASEVCIKELPRIYEELPVPHNDSMTRTFLKIEDGCDRFCSYCAIPYARGRVRSRSISSIKEEARLCAEDGHKEIVLVGINLSCYGKDIGLTLADAIDAVCGVDGIERVRLSSLEPELLDYETLTRFSSQPKLCPHFHLSLQSGSNATLRRMNRRYTTEEYSEIVNNIRSLFPNCAITTDMMVGFAGETEEEFEESMAFAEKTGFAKIHAFAYSVREGTAAAKRTDHIPENIKQERFRILSSLDERLHSDFLRKQIGTWQKILVQKRTSPEFIYGLTPNYTPVRIYGSTAERHSVIKVRITGSSADYCTGVHIDD